MQVFVCYPEPLKCAEAFWNDRLRYNKQCIEVRQILDALAVYLLKVQTNTHNFQSTERVI